MSVVLCTRDRPHLLPAALEGIRMGLRDGDEVIVVDSASRTRQAGEAAGRFGFVVVRLDVAGLSRARNAGVAHAANPVIAFTDDDCRPTAAWIAGLARPFADPATGVALGRVVGEDGPADDPGPAPFRFDATAEVAVLGAGANMAFRKDALIAIGGFDEHLGAGTRLRSGEDHDAIWRALRAGWSGAYEPDAVVHHREWRSHTATARVRFGYGIGAGAVAAKIAKVDPHTGRRLLIRRAWRHGARQAFVDIGRRYERAAAGDVLYAAGVLVGALTVWGTPMRDGRLTKQPKS